MLYPGFARPGPRLHDFLPRGAPVEWRILARLVLGRILPHDVDVGIGPKFGYNPAHKAVRARQVFRQHQVTDKQPPVCDAVNLLKLACRCISLIAEAAWSG